MQYFFILGFKIFKQIYSLFSYPIYYLFTRLLFYLNGVYFSSFKSYGIPYIHLSLNAKCFIGEKFKMNNGVKFSNSGENGKCRIEVRENAILSIGNNVGISDVTITCYQKIIIGNNIIIGVGSQIRDTDNHSLNPNDRLNGLDWINKKTEPITIKDNVFIGAHCFVLKGVTIGENAIIGAGSVVTKDIEKNEIWAGNPAKFIKKIDHFCEK